MHIPIDNHASTAPPCNNPMLPPSPSLVNALLIYSLGYG